MQILLLRLHDAHVSQNDGCLNFVDENDEVLISGFGRRGKAKGDIPGVRFKVVKVSGVGLLALWKEKKVRVLATSASAFPDSLPRRSQDHKCCFGPTLTLCFYIHAILHMFDSTFIV